jgi:hypothetical protein
MIVEYLFLLLLVIGRYTFDDENRWCTSGRSGRDE